VTLPKLAALATLALALAGATRAHADKSVAFAPLATIDAADTPAPLRKLTVELENQIGRIAHVSLISSAKVAAAIRKARKPELRSCEGDATCLAELGKLVGAQIIVSGQIGGLGNSRIVYLSAVDVASKRQLRSTSLAVGSPTDSAASAIVRLLDPNHHRGMLHFLIDAKGATVYVNGSRVRLDAHDSLSLQVGTQAIRVTHPEYRDFVRFIDVEYGKTTDVHVDMKQYPIVQRDIEGNPIDRRGTYYVDPPVWRRWYVVGPAAVGLAILTGVIVGSIVHDLPNTPCRVVGGGPC
jgi:hypothetical protein